MPSLILPLPSQSAHVWPSTRPLPPHMRHTFSPVPGVPGGASSPGDISGGSRGDPNTIVNSFVVIPSGAAINVPRLAFYTERITAG